MSAQNIRGGKLLCSSMVLIRFCYILSSSDKELSCITNTLHDCTSMFYPELRKNKNDKDGQSLKHMFKNSSTFSY